MFGLGNFAVGNVRIHRDLRWRRNGRRIRNARDNIQNHGGMGYTAENLAHLYLKRAHTLAAVLGDARSFTACLLGRGATW